MSLVSFVIPCYRSENTITAVVDELRRTMPTLPQYDYELILVNDCSPDGTFSVISQLAENDERITAVDLAKNFGQHAALMAGFHHCASALTTTVRPLSTRWASCWRSWRRVTTWSMPPMRQSSIPPSATGVQGSTTR